MHVLREKEREREKERALGSGFGIQGLDFRVRIRDLNFRV